ncbi:HEAT repeat domain-containing protein [Streptomyces xanthophaeus]|uniref:HEAT repeat domain-containing protein n=1 Tax=Streptomyces xanthophaeus TaxID=67385 RepID=A0A919GVF2_9ACTN|nr:hypothetical protein [Streptomyces xanthophaeus]GHI84599.1 hypothetical protein Sxan_19630 [Streptomyces xanthophaeus]
MSGLQASLDGASSPSRSDRERAGSELAPFADVPAAAGALADLLLDAEDTAVTRRTAQALAQVGTVAAVRLIARALGGADDNQVNWLQTGVHDALVEPDDDAPDLAAVCAQLARDPEPAVRRGAAEILTWTDGTAR